MMRYTPLVGSIKFGRDTEQPRQRVKNERLQRRLDDATAAYADGKVAIGAGFVLERAGCVIAASPACDSDLNALVRFSDAGSTSRGSPLALIKDGALTCALAIYMAGDLILFRDRLGVDSLYYRHDAEGMTFSSSIADLEDETAFESLDAASAFTYLLHGRARLGRSFQVGLESVPSAHFVRCRADPGDPERYWSPLGNPMPVEPRSSRVDRLSGHLQQACSDGFTAEGNALLLSGGIDSSYLAYTASRAHRDTTVCYTVTYADHRYDDEAHYAQIVADEFGLPLKRVVITVDESVRQLKTILNEPRPVSAWATICSNALVDAAVADGNTHIVSGLGADEILANYRKALDYYFRIRRLVNAHGAGSPDLCDYVTAADDVLFPGVADLFSNTALDQILSAAHDRREPAEDLRAFYQECGPVDRSAHLFAYFVAHECQHRLPDALLRDFGSYAQRSGAHIAFPFLDFRLVEAACSLYPSERFQYHDAAWHSKVTMRSMVSPVLPAAIMQRGRGTFDFPFGPYLEHEPFRAVVAEELARSPLWDTGLLKRSALAYYLDCIERRGADAAIDPRRWPELWALLTLGAWYGRSTRC